MFLNQGNTVLDATTLTDLDKLGNISLSQMKTLPFVGPYYKGKIVPRTSDEMCGGEFGGDCLKFVQKYLKFEWYNTRCEKFGESCSKSIFKSHICTAEEIS